MSSFGAVRTIDLKPNGGKIPVNLKNRQGLHNQIFVHRSCWRFT
jgi:hypothetical protein